MYGGTSEDVESEGVMIDGMETRAEVMFWIAFVLILSSDQASSTDIFWDILPSNRVLDTVKSVWASVKKGMHVRQSLHGGSFGSLRAIRNDME